MNKVVIIGAVSLLTGFAAGQERSPKLGFVANDQDPYWYSGATVDGSFYRSIDGGCTWIRQDIPANDGLYALDHCEINKYWLAGVSGWLGKAAGQSVS